MPNRTLRVRGGFNLLRTPRLRGDSNNPTSASQSLGAPPSPRFRLSMLFLFRGGDFFKIEWAETGLGRASSKEEAVGRKYIGAFDISLVVSSNALESILGIRLGHFR